MDYYNYISRLYRGCSFPGNAGKLQIKAVLSSEIPRADYTVSLARRREFSVTPLFKPIYSHSMQYTDSSACHALLFVFVLVPCFLVVFEWAAVAFLIARF